MDAMVLDPLTGNLLVIRDGCVLVTLNPTMNAVQLAPGLLLDEAAQSFWLAVLREVVAHTKGTAIGTWERIPYLPPDKDSAAYRETEARLPRKGEKVLICVEDGEWTLGRYLGDGGWNPNLSAATHYARVATPTTHALNRQVALDPPAFSSNTSHRGVTMPLKWVRVPPYPVDFQSTEWREVADRVSPDEHVLVTWRRLSSWTVARFIAESRRWVNPQGMELAWPDWFARIELPE